MAGFQKATRHQAKLRLALICPAGAGKTYTALKVAEGLGGKIALIDTERGSASKYSHVTDFDVLELVSFAPERYIDAIHEAEAEGYGVLVIDSLSHAWSGKDGILEFVDKRKAQSRGNDFAVWRDATPLQNKLVDTILGAKLHVIATMRTKMEYVIEKDEKSGKNIPRKIGLQPVQRDQIEFEFDLVGDMDQDHRLLVTKSRIEQFADAVLAKPGPELGKQLAEWLSQGEPAKESAPEPEPSPTTVTKAPPKPKTAAQVTAEAFPPGDYTASESVPAAPNVHAEQRRKDTIQWMNEIQPQMKAWELKFSDLPFLKFKKGEAVEPETIITACMGWAAGGPPSKTPGAHLLDLAREIVKGREA